MHLMSKAPEIVSQIELVVPIPHSPIPGAEAFAQKLEKELEAGAIQYATPVSKYRFGGRIFMEETQEERDKAAMLDFRVDAKAVAGRNIFLVDDSIVRGTNASRIVRAFRAAGAGKVFFGTLWPMVIDSCFQGINTPTQSELIGGAVRRRRSRDRGGARRRLPLLPADRGVPRDGDQGSPGVHGLHHRPACGQVRARRRGSSAPTRPGQLKIAQYPCHLPGGWGNVQHTVGSDRWP